LPGASFIPLVIADPAPDADVVGLKAARTR